MPGAWYPYPDEWAGSLKLEGLSAKWVCNGECCATCPLESGWECGGIIGYVFSKGVGDRLDTLLDCMVSGYMGYAGTSAGGESGGGGMACSSGGGVVRPSCEERSDMVRSPVERLPLGAAPTARAIAARVAELELLLDPGDKWIR